ncbi:MAG: hypothetical protein DRJ42_27585, partial [Deltaproteobacteria bacterium]
SSLVALGIFLVVYQLGASRATEAPIRGARGLRRSQALEDGGSFVNIEPLMRLVAGWLAPLPIPKLRRSIDVQLALAGDWLGLTANEFLALSAISSVGAFTAGLIASPLMKLSPSFSIFFMGVGAMMPYLRMTGERDDRFKAINRALPISIDLAALCMGAGLDFPGALRQIVEKATNRRDPIVEEVNRILQELELGRTRRQALEAFGERCPTDPVRDFVGAVIQAEEKGNPLAEVLRIQARMLRMYRSVMAEENAAKAAVMMMGPLMLIFCAIIVILLGPFLLQGMGSGL